MLGGGRGGPGGFSVAVFVKVRAVGPQRGRGGEGRLGY